MARHKIMQPHGTVKRYRQGDCTDIKGVRVGHRCADCRRAMSIDNKRRRAGQPYGPNVDNVTQLRSVGGTSKISRVESNSHEPHIPGANEQAILDEFAEMIELGQNRLPIQMLLTGARILDDPEARNIHPTTMRQMQETYKILTATRKTKSRGRLASVSAMTSARKSG